MKLGMFKSPAKKVRTVMARRVEKYKLHEECVCVG